MIWMAEDAWNSRDPASINDQRIGESDRKLRWERKTST